MIVATLVSLAGIFLAYLMYYKKSLARDWFTSRAPITYSIVHNKYFIDEFYNLSIVYATRSVSLFLRFIELFLVEGLMKLVAGVVSTAGKTGSRLQSGQTQTYGMAAFLGLAVLLLIFALTGGYLG
jgi:NADH-quinone oxidoreductase subunit L